MEASPTRAQGTSKLNLDNVVTLTVHECRLPRRGSAALLWYAAWRKCSCSRGGEAAGPGRVQVRHRRDIQFIDSDLIPPLLMRGFRL